MPFNYCGVSTVSYSLLSFLNFSMATFTVSTSKGKKVLVHNNFDFHLRLKSKDGRKLYWRCSQRDICNATCITGPFEQEPIHVFKVGNHTHEQRRAEVQVRRTVANIRERALQSPEPSSIINCARRTRYNTERRSGNSHA